MYSVYKVTYINYLIQLLDCYIQYSRDTSDHFNHVKCFKSAFYIVFCTGANPGFFLGEGAQVRNGVIDFFLQNTSCIRKPQVISGGGGAHPLHPPPRSAPAATLICPCVC